MFFLSYLVAGLLESSLECIKQLHVQLNLSSLQVGKGTTTKRKVLQLHSRTNESFYLIVAPSIFSNGSQSKSKTFY